MAKSKAERTKEWKRNNPEKMREYARKQRLRTEDKEYRRAYNLREKIERPFMHVHKEIQTRARKNGIPYDLCESFLKSIWTGVCPVFKTPIEIGYGKKDRTHNAENRASLDRIVPQRGYVKGNVVWISFKANRIKNDGTLEDHVAISVFMAALVGSSINNQDNKEKS